ncbi:hypothetical protein BC835DRAFT_1380690 [Cytidiella melzeri]|nr:hypothetical protein BC835DRAFT_1380690 [Cytidiella melzeri]
MQCLMLYALCPGFSLYASTSIDQACRRVLEQHPDIMDHQVQTSTQKQTLLTHLLLEPCFTVVYHYFCLVYLWVW